MKVVKLVWSWYDGDGVYTNGAESLENIIEEIFDPGFMQLLTFNAVS